METENEKLVKKKERKKEKVVLKYLYQVFASYSAAFPSKPGIDSGRERVGKSSIVKSRFV